MHSWAGSLERFLAEFSHGRGLGILHPNLNGDVSLARQVPYFGPDWQQDQEEQGLRGEEGALGYQTSGTQAGGARSTPMPTLRGTDDGGGGGQREPERLIRTYKEASNLVVSVCFSLLSTQSLGVVLRKKLSLLRCFSLLLPLLPLLLLPRPLLVTVPVMCCLLSAVSLAAQGSEGNSFEFCHSPLFLSPL